MTILASSVCVSTAGEEIAYPTLTFAKCVVQLSACLGCVFDWVFRAPACPVVISKFFPLKSVKKGLHPILKLL